LIADMRYALQGYDIPVPVPLPPGTPAADPSPALTPALAAPLKAAFEAGYTALYGHTVPEAAVEVAAWRVIVEGPHPALSPAPPAGGNTGGGAAALKGHRRAWTGAGFEEVPVYDRYALVPGSTLAGPAIVEERESTAVIAGPATIEVDPAGTLIARPVPDAASS
ncbi:MAG: hypothetical protein AAFN17_15120, partial [Pseudomonadota bacterium]